jgi:hypothetical protein
MSDTYATEKSFSAGGATGSASAGPSYAVGEEIKLSDRTLLRPIHGGLAEAGVVRERFLDSGGVYQYMVHFPGQAGTVLAARSDLQPLQRPFPAIDTSRGPVSSLKIAEAKLIEVSARLRIQVSRGCMPDKDDFADQAALAAGLAKVCGLTPGELLEQLNPQIDRKVRLIERKNASALAANDIPKPGDGKATSVNRSTRQTSRPATGRKAPGKSKAAGRR